MDKFKKLVWRAYMDEIREFKELSGNEQRAIVQAYFDEKEGVKRSLIIVSSLFSGNGYLDETYTDIELGIKANEFLNAFSLEVAVMGEIGLGPDLSCEFRENGKRW
jgi:hypothetical protein